MYFVNLRIEYRRCTPAFTFGLILAGLFLFFFSLMGCTMVRMYDVDLAFVECIQ